MIWAQWVRCWLLDEHDLIEKILTGPMGYLHGIVRCQRCGKRF